MKPPMKRDEIQFTVWRALVAIYLAVAIGWALAAAYKEVTR